MATKQVFSEYEINQMFIKVEGSETYEDTSCLGNFEEELEVRVMQKKCKGKVAKVRVKGTGNGTLKLSMHCPYEIYTKVYGMALDTLKEGVQAYGENSIHKEFSITQRVFDEDNVEKFKAYPKCIIKSSMARKVEQGAEEVAEIDMEISVMPDEFGNGMYEALSADLTDETLKTDWLTKFTPSMARITEA